MRFGLIFGMGEGGGEGRGGEWSGVGGLGCVKVFG